MIGVASEVASGVASEAPWRKASPGLVFAVVVLVAPAAGGVSGAGGAGAESKPADVVAANVCFPAAATAGAGVVDPFHAPPEEARRMNADGTAAYRLGRWDEARAKFRAARGRDPEFLAPSLNVAGSFVRQERFAEAVDEATRLLDAAFLPWAAEIATSADLGALKVVPEGKRLRAATEAARARWAAALADDVILVARTRAPLKLAEPVEGQVTALVLGPRQEVFAWSPQTRRYRQLTSEEGRVLVVARSRDGRRVAYATAEKLIRSPAAPPALRGVVLKELDLGTLALLGEARVDGDVRRVEIFASKAGGFWYALDRTGTTSTVRIESGRLDPIVPMLPMGAPRGTPPAAILTGTGVGPQSAPVPLPARCGGTTRDVQPKEGARRVEVRRASTVIAVGGPFGAGLNGLPIP